MTFEIYRRGGEWRFRFKAFNGKILLQSEGYKRKCDCLRGIKRIREGAQWAEIKEL